MKKKPKENLESFLRDQISNKKCLLIFLNNRFCIEIECSKVDFYEDYFSLDASDISYIDLTHHYNQQYPTLSGKINIPYTAISCIIEK